MWTERSEYTPSQPKRGRPGASAVLPQQSCLVAADDARPLLPRFVRPPFAALEFFVRVVGCSRLPFSLVLPPCPPLPAGSIDRSAFVLIGSDRDQIATLGPASCTKDQIEALFLAGVDVFRLNFSHGAHEEKAKVCGCGCVFRVAVRCGLLESNARSVLSFGSD